MIKTLIRRTALVLNLAFFAGVLCLAAGMAAGVRAEEPIAAETVSDDFEAIGRDGRVRSNQWLVLRSLRTARAETRIGLSTPRAVGGAVGRNRLRRRLRELLRARLDRIGPGWDLLVIARSAAAEADHAALAGALDSLLERSEIGR
jgi:ribonuclease P protein component